MIQDRLSAADALQSSDPNRAEAMYRAVVELYGQKPWAAEPVKPPKGFASENNRETVAGSVPHLRDTKCRMPGTQYGP